MLEVSLVASLGEDSQSTLNNGYGNGDGNGYGNGDGNGDGNGYGNGNGYGYGEPAPEEWRAE